MKDKGSNILDKYKKSVDKRIQRRVSEIKRKDKDAKIFILDDSSVEADIVLVLKNENLSRADISLALNKMKRKEDSEITLGSIHSKSWSILSKMKRDGIIVSVKTDSENNPLWPWLYGIAKDIHIIRR